MIVRWVWHESFLGKRQEMSVNVIIIHKESACRRSQLWIFSWTFYDAFAMCLSPAGNFTQKNHGRFRKSLEGCVGCNDGHKRFITSSAYSTTTWRRVIIEKKKKKRPKIITVEPIGPTVIGLWKKSNLRNTPTCIKTIAICAVYAHSTMYYHIAVQKATWTRQTRRYWRKRCIDMIICRV